VRHSRRKRSGFRPRRTLLPFFFRLRKLKVCEYLGYLQKTQYLPAEEIVELQLAKLRELIRHALQTVPYYREVFTSRKISAEDIRTLDDVKLLPILTKEQIVSMPRSTFLSPGEGPAFAIRKTSGTTGQPVEVLVDREAYAWSVAARYRCEQWHSIKIGDRQARLWGRPHDRRSRWRQSIRDLSLGRKTISSNTIDSASLRREVRRILSYKPDYIYGYTSMILALAEHLTPPPKSLNTLKLKAVICTAEQLYPFQKRFLKEVFACPVVDEYGCSETDILAFDCEYGRRHIIAENVLLETINRQDSGIGEILVTDLNNRLMPLIRYKLGDLGFISTDTCPCGRGLPILSSIEGRSTDQYILTPDGRKIHSVIFPHLLDELAGQGISTKQFRVVQKELHTIMFYIVPQNCEDCPRIDSLISMKLARQLPKEMRLETVYVDHIDSPSEKFSYFEPYHEGRELWGRAPLGRFQGGREGDVAHSGG